MKSYCKGLVIDEEFVRSAYFSWTTSQAGRKNAHRIAEEHGSAEKLINEIADEIATRSLTLRPIRRYQHTEPTNGKVRTIGVESVKQQVCDYVVIQALEPLLQAKVGFYQVASVRGKGQLFSARVIRTWVHRGGYWVHLDVRQCYPSISHGVVLSILAKYVRSSDVLYLARTLLATYGDGLDIGSYFSLRVAQLVLSFGYHYVEDLGKSRRGKHHALVNHQLWYADDILLMSRDKRDLRIATRALEKYLQNYLGLRLKPWKICQVSDDEPIDMAGYITRPDRTTIRGSIFIRARRSVRYYQHHPSIRQARRVCSYWGWLKHSDSRSAVNRNRVKEITTDARKTVSLYG